MTEKAFRQLNIDPEFKNLIRPLRREEYRQLELNLVMEGCREDIIAWNDTIVDGHNRYEICNKMRIPYGVKELDFPSRDAAIAWICANQLGRRNISEETRKYLIGKQYEAEKKVQRNRNGYNQYRPNPNITVGRGRPIDEESGRRTAARLGRKYHVSGATVQKYAKYSAALDTIEQNAPELVPHILSGAYKISFENIVALSEMEPEELKALSKKIPMLSLVTVNRDDAFIPMLLPSPAQRRQSSRQSRRCPPMTRMRKLLDLLLRSPPG